MPPYWNRFYRRKNYGRRKWWFRRRRSRIPFQRRRTRRKRHRTYRKVKRKRFYKKKLKLTVQQFQPNKINKCKIIGTKCLFQGSPLRSNNNYIQYVYSKTPENHPGGGGWSMLVFSLESLYEDFLHLQNIWTRSNTALPLVRYLGTSFKFYQSDFTDYVVVYDRCLPMITTPYSHADSSPIRMLSKKHKVIIPSRLTQQRKKPYKKVFIKPPTQFTNEWFFQRDICKIPLVQITATAVSLTHPFCAPKATSNNISLKMLGTKLFNNPNFQSFPQTSGYSPKEYYTEHHEPQKMYLWSTSQHLTDGTEVSSSNIKSLQLTPLTNTKLNRAGTPLQTGTNSQQHWGNPFYHDNLDRQSISIYLSQMSPLDAMELINNSSTKKYSLITPTTSMFYTVRYNPDTDTGEGNKIYLVSNSRATSWKEPENEVLIFHGFPLYILAWGWTDYIKKTKQTVDPDQNYIVVIQTKQFDVEEQYYVPIDQDFIDGYDPYVKHPDHGHIEPSQYSNEHWFPKLQFQQQSLEKLCMSGPACNRNTESQYLQAFCKYKFYFKWGGCPKQIENIFDPCSQSHWNIPHYINGRLEIQNPNTSPQTEIYEWDWKGDYIKDSCIQRIKDNTTTDKPTLSISETASNPKATKTLKEKEQTTKEEEKILQQQLKFLKHQQQQLRALIQQLT
nr:MAG: ORF1 [TTV-like mini virus]